MSYKNLKALLDKDLFANWEVVQMCDKKKSDEAYLTYYYLGDNSSRIFEFDGFGPDDKGIIERDTYSTNGIDYITYYDEWGDPSEKIKRFNDSYGDADATQLSKEFILNYMNSIVEKIDLCYIENTYTKTADGFKVEVVLDPFCLTIHGFGPRYSYDSVQNYI